MDNKVLLLTEEEIIKILTMEDAIEAVEYAFKEKGLGRVQMPAKVYLTFEKYTGDLRTMPSYLEKLDIAGVKVVNSHPNNTKLYGKSVVMATIILIDPRTGAPLSIMGGTYITAMRTGAVGGLATKYLAGKDSEILGLIGAGVQAMTQLRAISKTLNLKEVRVYDISEKALCKFIKEAMKNFALKISRCETAEECVKYADVVCSTTPSTSPIIKKKWIHKGMHINAIGADASGKQELDPEILKNAKIVVDDLEQALHSGEINVPYSQGILKKEEIYAELGDIIVGNKLSRISDDEIIVFDSTGLSIQDISTAAKVFENAKATNVGKWITL